jgi:hypothetical protein
VVIVDQLLAMLAEFVTRSRARDPKVKVAREFAYRE